MQLKFKNIFILLTIPHTLATVHVQKKEDLRKGARDILLRFWHTTSHDEW